MMSRIIIFYEKHGNRYFSAKTDEELHAACLKIIKERTWLFSKPESPELEPIPDVDIDENSQIGKEINKIKHENKRRIAWFDDDMYWYNSVQRVLAEQSGELAYKIITYRNDHEYEGYGIVYLESAE